MPPEKADLFEKAKEEMKEYLSSGNLPEIRMMPGAVWAVVLEEKEE